MLIFPDLFGEAELLEFTEKDYAALEGVLDATLSKHLLRYLQNSDANPTLVATIKDCLGKTIESYTFHYVLREKGILELIGSLSPENLLATNADYNDIKDKLTFLDKNLYKLRIEIPARTKTAYEDFIDSMRAVLLRMDDKGIEPSFPNVLERIEVNKFVFYVPNARNHPTGCNIVNSKKRQWIMCLRGLEFKEYCDSKGINYIDRRNF